MTKNPQVETVLVTGAGGRLGTLLRAGFSKGRSTGPRFVFQSRNACADVMWAPGDPISTLPRCDMIVALWGATSGTDEDLAANTRLVQTGADLAQELGARGVVHMSSMAVYGPGRDMTEEHPTAPLGGYGASKLAMERAVAQLPPYGTRHICLRVGNIVGAESLAPALRRPENAEIDRFPDGEGPIRSYIGAGDLLQVFQGLAALPFDHWPAILNVTAPKPVGMDDLVRAAGKGITWKDQPDATNQHATMDTTRLRDLMPDLTLKSDAAALIKEWSALDRPA